MMRDCGGCRVSAKNIYGLGVEIYGFSEAESRGTN